MQSGIYKIQHKDSGRLYIGSSKDISYRLRKHKERLVSGCHQNPHLQSAYKKYGADAFIFEPMIFCEQKDLIFYEQKIMDGFKSYDNNFGYNIRKIAESNAGIDSKRLTHRSGDKYNRLTLVSLHEKRQHGNKWLCKCDCGNMTVVNVAAVKQGKIKSCGCLKSEILRTNRAAVSGQRYYRLTSVSPVGKNSQGCIVWMFQCDCGKNKIATISHVKRGVIKSCGCLRVESMLKNRKR